MARNPVYGSDRWRKFRARIIRQRGRVCAVPDCSSDMSLPRMTHVDHIVAIEDGGEIYDPGNVQILCKPHHDAKTSTDRAVRVAGGSEQIRSPNA